MQFGIGMILRSWQCKASLPEFSNCLHMPDETVEQFIYRLNDICARMVNNTGEAMKKTQVIKGICNEFAAFAQIEARRDIRLGGILHQH